MPHAAAPAHTKHKTNTNVNANQSRAGAGANRSTRGSSANASPYGYTYGHGSNARRYQAHGYGRGYRNRYYGRNYGYGRSQGSNRSVVNRLRSVDASLSRIDHNYQGHRVRALHAITMAIRQLSHRSMVYHGSGFAPGMNPNRMMAMRTRQGGGGQGVGAPRRQPMTQAQSDARMGQALRSLQGVNMQLTSQGFSTNSHSRARGHVQHAMRELNTRPVDPLKTLAFRAAMIPESPWLADAYSSTASSDFEIRAPFSATSIR